ncbi:MAG: hypothetical protein WBR28_05270, partial [Mycobacterium sp.]
ASAAVTTSGAVAAGAPYGLFSGGGNREHYRRQCLRVAVTALESQLWWRRQAITANWCPGSLAPS